MVFGPDNTVIFTNVPVSHGSLEVDMMPVAVLPLHNPNTEGDFNGAQIQLVAYPPEPPISITFSDGLCHLSWRGGRLLQATNILGPWATNTWVSPQVFAPTGQMQFFNLVTNIF